MVEVDEVGLDASSLLLWTVPGIMSYLSTIKTGIVRVSCSLGYPSLVVTLMPPSLATSSSPIVWCMALGQIHWYGSVIHGRWGIGGIVLRSSTSPLPS